MDLSAMPYCRAGRYVERLSSASAAMLQTMSFELMTQVRAALLSFYATVPRVIESVQLAKSSGFLKFPIGPRKC
jgi:hypothetical protein